MNRTIDTVRSGRTARMAQAGVLAVCLLGSGALRAEPLLALELLPHATARGHQVRLADVIRLDGEAQRLDPVWQQAVLAAAPRVGQIAHLSRAQIEHALRTLRLAQARQIEWRGAQAVQVHLAQQAVDGTQLQQVAQQALEQALTERGASARVQLARAVPDLAVPAGALAVTALPLAGERLYSGMPVWLALAVDGRFYRRVAVHFVLDGEPVEVAPDASRVQKGAQVTLLVRHGAVQVQTMARVQQDGAAGQWVRVRPLAAAESVLARVRSGTLVEIE